MVIESVHRRSLWKIFRANGIPSHLVEIIKSFYDNFTCSFGDGDFLFEVDTGVRNGCVMSTLLFNHVVNWIMWRTTEDQFRSIRWTALLGFLSIFVNVIHASVLALSFNKLVYIYIFLNQSKINVFSLIF